MAVAGVFVLLAGWLTLTVSGTAAIRGRQPDRALTFMPWDARALTARAERRLATIGITPATIAASRRDVIAALGRDPTVVAAWRTLALTEAASNRKTAASNLMRVSERLSRRDLPTQLWLIEEQVARGNVAGALVHYDIALRTSLASYDTLIPVLVAAASDPNVVEPLGRLLATRPSWSNFFYYKLSQSPPPPQQAARLLEVARLGGPLNNPEMVGVLMARMIADGGYASALRVYAMQAGTKGGPTKGLVDGDFDSSGAYPPFDWEFANAPELGAEIRQDAAATGRVLTAFATADRAGMAARQLLVLPAGARQLRFRAGRTEAPAAKLTWRMFCAGTEATPLLTLPVDLGNPQAVQRAMLTIPPGCPAQWILLEVAADDPGLSEAWVDAVAVAPANNGNVVR